jgi:hypothetical protein
LEEARSALGREHRQPHQTAVPHQRLRQRLNELLVVASLRADGDLQGDRPQHVIERAGGDAEQENAGRQDQQRIVRSLAPPTGRDLGFAGF